jgi:hypothetical protein
MEKKRGLRCRFTKQWIVLCNAELEDVVLLKLSGFGVSVLLFCIFYHAYRCVTEKKRGLQCGLPSGGLLCVMLNLFTEMCASMWAEQYCS